jgi:hypothetical protein
MSLERQYIIECFINIYCPSILEYRNYFKISTNRDGFKKIHYFMNKDGLFDQYLRNKEIFSQVHIEYEFEKLINLFENKNRYYKDLYEFDSVQQIVEPIRKNQLTTAKNSYYISDVICYYPQGLNKVIIENEDHVFKPLIDKDQLIDLLLKQNI